MYKKRERDDIDAESANNEEQFATQFFNFMRKHLDIVISRCLFHKSIWISAPIPTTKSTLWMTSMNPPLAQYSMSKAGC
jgi:hypothetical protein